MKDSRGQLNRTVVSPISFTVSKPHESVDSASLGLQVVVRNRQESSNHVHVNEHTVVLDRGRNVVLVDLLSLIEIVPVSLSVKLVNDAALLNHISSDVESIVDLTTLLSQTHSLVVEIEVSSDCDGSVSVDNNHVLIGAKFKTDDEGVNVHGVVVGSASFLKAVSESDESVDLSGVGFFGPGGDHQESADNVSVDGEVKVGELGINTGFVDSLGVSKVVPVFGFEELINFGPDIEESD